METAVRDTATARPRFVERRRAGSVPPRGKGFVERRRPLLVVDVEDLHDGDLQEVLADGLDFGVGSDDAVGAAAALAALIVYSAPAALAAHDLER
jgi:hypothetical protein